MPSIPTITQPANGSRGLGNAPRVFGKADPWTSVQFFEHGNPNDMKGQVVADGNGDYAVDLALPYEMTFVCRSCNGNDCSGWSNGLSIAP